MPERPRTRRPARAIPQAIRSVPVATIASGTVDDIAEEILVEFDQTIAPQVNQQPGGVQATFAGGVVYEAAYNAADMIDGYNLRIPAPGVPAGAITIRFTNMDEIKDNDGLVHTLPSQTLTL